MWESEGMENLPNKRPAKAMAMAAWARIPSSVFSLPTITSPSSSSPSSSASLTPLLVLDLADELWFYRSVLPSISLPCLPHFPFSPASGPPDTSTLIAQCMFDGDYTPSTLAPSASPRARPDSEQTEYPSWYLDVPCPEHPDHKENGHPNAYPGYSSMTDSDGEDESYHRGYPRLLPGEDEEAFHYDTAHSDWDDDDAYAYNGVNVPSDCEEKQPSHVLEEEELSAYDDKSNGCNEPEDAMSGIYDVAAFLKGQHSDETEEVKKMQSTIPSQILQEVVLQVSAASHFKVSAGKDQTDMKESLKLWAHAVALTLPWKAAAQARPLL